MRKRRLPALLAGLLLLVLSAAPVSAGRLTLSKISATYEPLPGMTAKCVGLHIVTRNQIRDNEICLVTDDTNTMVAGTFSATDVFGSWPAFDDPPTLTLWYSDFDGAIASSWRVAVLDLGHDRFLWLVTANFPVA